MPALLAIRPDKISDTAWESFKERFSVDEGFIDDSVDLRSPETTQNPEKSGQLPTDLEILNIAYSLENGHQEDEADVVESLRISLEKLKERIKAATSREKKLP